MFLSPWSNPLAKESWCAVAELLSHVCVWLASLSSSFADVRCTDRQGLQVQVTDDLNLHRRLQFIQYRTGFRQTPALVLDKISGPMGARFLSSSGLGFGNLIGRAQFPPAPALDKNRSPIAAKGKGPKPPKGKRHKSI